MAADRDRFYVQHVLDATDRIKEYTRGFDRDQFLRSPMAQDAVIRQLQIVGEAVKHLSPAFRETYPQMRWRDISGMRDKLIHDYIGVDVEAVWKTVEEDVPALGRFARGVLDPPDHTTQL